MMLLSYFVLSPSFHILFLYNMHVHIFKLDFNITMFLFTLAVE